MSREAAIFATVLVFSAGCARVADPIAQQPALDQTLLAAIRANDQGTVQALLDRGADVQAHDETGATALMQAVLNADAAMVRLLLDRGAAVNAQNKVGARALLWAVDDPEKVRLLLEHGAEVDLAADAWGFTTLVIAARIAGAAPTLQLLREHGASLEANKGGFTPLMAAALSGDLENVRCLLRQGADAATRNGSGYSPLHAAAFNGDAELVRLLLDHGADPNAQLHLKNPADDFATPLIVAALMGKADMVRLLLERGADPNAQGGTFARTALLCAATTGSVETVRLLLEKGARVNAEDWAGNTPLAWARRRGKTPIVQLLRQTGGREPPARKLPSPPHPNPSSPQRGRGAKGTDSDAATAVRTSLPLLQRSGRHFLDKNACFSCHHQALVAMAVGLARQRGFAVDEAIAGQQRAAVLQTLDEHRESILLGFGVTDPPVPAWALVGLAAEGQAPNPTTDALVHYLVLAQRLDGSWRTPVNRPPHDASDFTFTALSVRGLEHYVPPGRRPEIEDRIARARAWLLRRRPQETEDRAFRLLGLRWTRAEVEPIRQAVADLLREQREDGGWAQLPTLASDAYATGQVLYALHEGGGLPTAAPAYRRGVEFLLKSQLADGSWFVATRSFPFQAYSGSGFPHGSSQFISCAATCWATMALTFAAAPECTVGQNSNRIGQVSRPCFGWHALSLRRACFWFPPPRWGSVGVGGMLSSAHPHPGPPPGMGEGAEEHALRRLRACHAVWPRQHRNAFPRPARALTGRFAAKDNLTAGRMRPRAADAARFGTRPGRIRPWRPST